jgi:cell division transport system permease protein
LSAMKTEVITAMKASTFVRHIRESLKSLGRNGWMTFASVSAVTVTLLLVGVFGIIMMNLNKLAEDLENDVEIRVHIDIIMDENEAKIAEDTLMKQIQNMPDVDKIVYSSKDDELQNMIKDLGEDFSLYEQNNPLHSVLYVKAKDPQQTAKVAKAIEKLDNVYAAKYGEGKVEKLFNILNISRNVGLVLIVGLLFTAMFLISNTIRITIVARRDEIEIMRLVGATNSFIRIPFVLEGMFLGLIGALIPVIIVSVLYSNIYSALEERLKGELVQLVEVSMLLTNINILLVILGIFIGIWGSFMSVRKFLKI